MHGSGISCLQRFIECRPILFTSTFGFVFCFKWSEDSYHPEDYYNDGPEAEIPWFASQLSDDSCATLALLNILLNCEDVDIGPTLTSFKEYTSQMDPKVGRKGTGALRNTYNTRDAWPMSCKFFKIPTRAQLVRPVRYHHSYLSHLRIIIAP